MASTGFLGADTDQLDLLAHGMRSGAGDLAAIESRLRSGAGRITWWGQDGDDFRGRMDGVVTVLARSVELLDGAGRLIAGQSAQQRAASAATNAGSAAGPALRPVTGATGTPPNPGTTDSWPPAGASPGAVAAWWAGLSARQRAVLIAEDPRRVGGLDGLPATDRSAANRAVLVAQLRTLYLQRESLTDHLWLAMLLDSVGTRSRIAALSGRIRGLEQVEFTLNTRPDAYLLGIGVGGDSGRMIMALGDPDTADAVSVLVPGMTTSVDDAGEQIRRAGEIRSAALAAEGPGGGQAVSSVIWLGYDAPPGVVGAASASRADAGSADLDRFVDGLRAAHQGDPARITAIGHSYGSLVVGTADHGHDLAVDDIFFIGSPGVGVNSASALSVGADHVYAMTMPNDVIRYTPSPSEVEGAGLGIALTLPATAPMTLEPLAHLADANDPNLRFGTSPASAQFGATVIPGRYDPAGPVRAHSSYFDPTGPALPAIGAVIVGERPGSAGHR